MMDHHEQLHQTTLVCVRLIITLYQSLICIHILFYLVITATLTDSSEAEDVIFSGEDNTVNEITIPASFIKCRSEATGMQTS